MHRIMSNPVAMRFWSNLPHEIFGQTEQWIASMVETDPMSSDDFIVTLGGALIGASSGIDARRGGSPSGAP